MFNALEHARAGAAALAALLDSVGNPVQRARIAAALVPKVAKYKAASSALERLRLANEIRILLGQLGSNAASGASLEVLRAVAAGRHDDMGALNLWAKIQSDLEDQWGEDYDAALSSEAAKAAHAAINQWMKVELEEHV